VDEEQSIVITTIGTAIEDETDPDELLARELYDEILPSIPRSDRQVFKNMWPDYVKMKARIEEYLRVDDRFRKDDLIWFWNNCDRFPARGCVNLKELESHLYAEPNHSKREKFIEECNIKFPDEEMP